jgi:hypothetical protein
MKPIKVKKYDTDTYYQHIADTPNGERRKKGNN